LSDESPRDNPSERERESTTDVASVTPLKSVKDRSASSRTASAAAARANIERRNWSRVV
jgi:hypothetical protein